MGRGGWLILGGAVALIGGVVALLNPFAATFAAVLIAGWAFFIGGVLQLVAGFDKESTVGRGWAIALGLLSLALGVWLIFDPFAGMLSLTLAIAVLLLASGGARLVSAFTHAGSPRWLMALSGLISLGLGVLILIGYPGSASAILGLFLGIELVFAGVAYIALGAALKQARRQPVADDRPL